MYTYLKTRLITFIRGWLFSILIAVLVATSFKSAIADWNDVPTGSMIPTIIEGDRIFVNKLAYDFKVPFTTFQIVRWANPERFDIVVFFSPVDGKRLVKRAIGLPGDIICMQDNRLFINHKGAVYNRFDYNQLFERIPGMKTYRHVYDEKLNGNTHRVMLTPSNLSIRSFKSMRVPAGKYFMMGDNRDNSADSRYFGFVDRSQIVGRATSVVLSREGSFLHPRWDRFFKKL